MLFKHKRTRELTCELVDVKRTGKKEVYICAMGNMTFRQNKEVFLSEWQKLNPMEMERAYMHRTDGLDLTKGEWIKKKTWTGSLK